MPGKSLSSRCDLPGSPPSQTRMSPARSSYRQRSSFGNVITGKSVRSTRSHWTLVFLMYGARSGPDARSADNIRPSCTSATSPRVDECQLLGGPDNASARAASKMPSPDAALYELHTVSMAVRTSTIRCCSSTGGSANSYHVRSLKLMYGLTDPLLCLIECS